MDSDIRPTTLADLLNRLRVEAGISMYELAKRSGVNRSTLMRIEDGTTTGPDSATLNTLARALDVEPELFYDAVWQGADTPDTPLPSPAVYFRSKYRLSSEQIAKIERSIEEVANRPSQASATKARTKKNNMTERRSP